MDYQYSINKLNEELKNIIRDISQAIDPVLIQNLENKKLAYEDEIRRLTRIQFEENTQSVYFDDDR